ELDRVKPISPDLIDKTLGEFVKIDEVNLSLAGDGYGTHFILLPTTPELDDDIDGGADKEAYNLQGTLLGFSNTMTGSDPVIQTRFRDHNIHESPDELIGPRNFFLPEEYENADHQFRGRFDDYGQFRGTVKIYGEKKVFVCNWVEGRGRPVKCGRFFIDFAYVQGEPEATRLSAEDFRAMNDKLVRLGGLYIYRDGIRILPYGRQDYDWLDIEARKSRAHKDWFFSYRRLFGYVAITHERNGALSEKAGREGFRQNQAYRDFRAILINLFQRLAMEFFRRSSAQSEIF